MDKKLARYIDSMAKQMPPAMQMYLKSSVVYIGEDGKLKVDKTQDLRPINHSKRIKNIFIKLEKKVKVKTLKDKMDLILLISNVYFMQIQYKMKQFENSVEEVSLTPSEEAKTMKEVEYRLNKKDIDDAVFKTPLEVELEDSTSKKVKSVKEVKTNKSEQIIETGKEGVKLKRKGLKKVIEELKTENSPLIKSEDDGAKEIIENLKQESKRGRKRKAKD